MPTRTITGTVSSNSSADLTAGKYVGFTVSSDTGAISTGAISAARLSLSAIRCYTTTAYLEVIFHSTSHPTLAQTGTLSGDSTIHAEDFTLEALSNTLVTGTPSTIYLLIKKTSGDGNKINFRDNCTLTLEIDYTLPPTACTPPSNVKLGSTSSTGEAVALSWSAGGSGTNNAVQGYEIQRAQSSDGSTWGSWAALTTTTGTSLNVAPPAAYGISYKYRIRTRGAAGESYYSAWVESSNTLARTHPTLSAYTDPTITAGTTQVKAAHMLELQSNINTLRAGLSMAAYAFESIRAGYTDLMDWNAHVEEMRDAIDRMGVAHETWLTLGENKPRADVIMQLRRVVAAI